MLLNFLTAWDSNFEDPKLLKQVISSGQCQNTYGRFHKVCMF